MEVSPVWDEDESSWRWQSYTPFGIGRKTMSYEQRANFWLSLGGMACVTVLAVFRCLDVNVAVGVVCALAGLVPIGGMVGNGWRRSDQKRADTKRTKVIVREVLKEEKPDASE